MILSTKRGGAVHAIVRHRLNECESLDASHSSTPSTSLEGGGFISHSRCFRLRANLTFRQPGASPEESLIAWAASKIT